MNQRIASATVGIYRDAVHIPTHFVYVPRPYSYVMNGLSGCCGVQSFGDASGSTTVGAGATAYTIPAWLQPYVPAAAQAAAALTERKDPRERIAVLQAKIANYKAMKAKVPILAVYYDNEIRKLQAQVGALQSQAQAASASEQATGQWRVLGQVGAGVGILAGVALVAVLTAGAVKLVRGAR